MKVILKCSITDNGNIIEPGERDVEAKFAKELISAGKAEAVKKPSEKPAVVAPQVAE